MRIIAFQYNTSAYTNAFYKAVENRNADVIPGKFRKRWIINNIIPSDIVHIHWPSFLYLSSGSNLKMLRRFLQFIIKMALIKFKGAKIFWTAHNILPHNPSKLHFLDILARHTIIILSSKIFVHGNEAKRLLIRRFPSCKNKCIRIPHGNWVEFYNTVISQKNARIALSLPADAFIFLFFGYCKRYKNLDGLLKVFIKHSTINDYLLVAGSFTDQSYQNEIEKVVKSNPRVRIDSRFIPNDEVPLYFNASDVMCVPYREILTSGTALLSMSYGKPTISVNIGALKDVITPETGILIQPNNNHELADSLQKAKSKSWSREIIIAHANKYTFNDAASIFLNECTQSDCKARLELSD